MSLSCWSKAEWFSSVCCISRVSFAVEGLCGVVHLIFVCLQSVGCTPLVRMLISVNGNDFFASLAILNVLSVLSKTWYGPSYGGCNGGLMASCRRNIWLQL